MRHDDIAATRLEAQLSGAAFYQGAPCNRGHAGIRYPGNKACRDCTREADAARRAGASEEEKERERVRKREAKRAGNWAPVDLAKRRTRERQIRARKRAQPEAVLQRQRVALELLSLRLNAAGERLRRMLPAYRDELRERIIIRDRLKAKRRRALKRGGSAAGAATNAEVMAIHESQGWRCAYCGSPSRPELDHKIAVSAGGSHAPDNLQFLCHPCNMAKHACPDDVFREMHGIPAITPWDGWIGRAVWLSIVAM